MLLAALAHASASSSSSLSSLSLPASDGGDDEDNAPASGDLLAAIACGVGAVASVVSLVLERSQWDIASYNRFSVATKVPVQVLCVSGPLVMVSACLYSLLAVLLLMGGTREVFFISASWAAICIDMSAVLYDSVAQMCANWVDLTLHAVNLFVVVHTFSRLPVLPGVFMVGGVVFWGVVLGMRLWRRLSDSKEPGRRPGNVSP